MGIKDQAFIISQYLWKGRKVKIDAEIRLAGVDPVSAIPVLLTAKVRGRKCWTGGRIAATHFIHSILNAHEIELQQQVTKDALVIAAPISRHQHT